MTSVIATYVHHLQTWTKRCHGEVDLNLVEWAVEHLRAWQTAGGNNFSSHTDEGTPFLERAGLGYAVATGILAWLRYADLYERRYASSIGKDEVLGPAWADWGRGLRELLNGELTVLGYQLDAGSLDHLIVAVLQAAGVEE